MASALLARAASDAASCGSLESNGGGGGSAPSAPLSSGGSGGTGNHRMRSDALHAPAGAQPHDDGEGGRTGAPAGGVSGRQRPTRAPLAYF